MNCRLFGKIDSLKMVGLKLIGSWKPRIRARSEQIPLGLIVSGLPIPQLAGDGEAQPGSGDVQIPEPRASATFEAGVGRETISDIMLKVPKASQNRLFIDEA